MAQTIEKWLLLLVLFPPMMILGIYVMWASQTNMAVLAVITFGAIIIYSVSTLVRGRNKIFWPGISWSLGYFLMGGYYLFVQGSEDNAIWLFTLAALSMAISAHHWRYSASTTIWPGIMLSFGLASMAISRLMGGYLIYVVILSLIVFATQRRKTRDTILWPGVVLAFELLGSSIYYAKFVSGSPASTIAVFSLIALWLALGARPVTAVVTLRRLWAVCLVFSAITCYDTIHFWVLFAGIMAALVKFSYFREPEDPNSQCDRGEDREQRFINQQWNRPLDSYYPMLLVEQITLWPRPGQQHFRKGGMPVCIVTGIDVDGTMQSLGIWLGDGRDGDLFWRQIHANLTQRGLREPIMICCSTPAPAPMRIARLWPNATIEVFRVNRYDMWNRVCNRIIPGMSAADMEMCHVNERHNSTIQLLQESCSSSKAAYGELGRHLRRRLHYHEATYRITIGAGWKALMDQWTATYPDRFAPVAE